jgi:hypothetical protein
MLRNFEYRSHSVNIRELLDRFNIDLPEQIALVRFEVITPDSFMWRFVIGKRVYYLYAEDYVPGINHIKAIFNQYLENDKWELVMPKSKLKFEDATPAKSAKTYKKPNDSNEIMQFAIDSGHDFVFLAQSNEDADCAQFSDSAPRGFDAYA